MRLTTNEQGERVMQYNPSIETIDDAKVDLVLVLSTNYKEYEGDE